MIIHTCSLIKQTTLLTYLHFFTSISCFQHFNINIAFNIMASTVLKHGQQRHLVVKTAHSNFAKHR